MNGRKSGRWMGRSFLVSSAVFVLSLGAYPQATGRQTIKRAPTKLPQKSEVKINLPLPSKTEVKVWDGQGRLGGEFFRTGKEVTIEKGRDDLNWWIQWRTDQEGAAKAIYQISLLPYGVQGSVAAPEGLVAADVISSIPSKGKDEFFQIDLARVFAGAGETASLGGPPAKIALKKPAGIKPPPASSQPVPGQLRFLRLVPKMRVSLPCLTYYLRVVTLDTQNTPVGVPSAPAIIHYGDAVSKPITYYEDPNAPKPMVKVNNPCVKIVGFEHFQDFQPEWLFHLVVTRDYQIGFAKYKKGQKLYMPPKKEDKNALDYITGAFGSLVNFVESSINWVSNAYASVKAKALEIAVSLAKNTVGCGETCQAAFSFALDYGLAVMGMPPSIPNFDAFSELGKDYLVKTIAEQSGLPEEAVRSAADAFQREIENAANGGSGGGWLRPDPAYQYKDAVLTVEIWNPTSRPTESTFVQLSQFRALFYFPNQGKYKTIGVPALRPGERLTFPVLLKPNSMQYTYDMESMTQRAWNEMIEKGVLLKVLVAAYGDNRPNEDQVMVIR